MYLLMLSRESGNILPLELMPKEYVTQFPTNLGCGIEGLGFAIQSSGLDSEFGHIELRV